jgi:CubicO group peptidase (beta-lactamase class C family)
MNDDNRKPLLLDWRSARHHERANAAPIEESPDDAGYGMFHESRRPMAASHPRGVMRAARILASSLFIAAPAVAQQPNRPDSTARLVDRVFDAWRDTEGPGCALGVSRDGRVVYEHGYGMANLETGTPIRPGTIFHVASVSKQFTAMSIMLLAAEGKLSVDDDIRKYIPEIPNYGTTITIRHLLTHTSGLRDQWSLIALKRGRFEEDRITEADVMDVVPRQKALNFTPGAEYLYSNTGFTLLGVIVKRVSGKSLRDFADERIFKPLGMTSTHFHDDYTMLVPGRASAYAPARNGWRVSIPNFDVYGATSLFTTVGDLLKWEANFDAPVVGTRAIIDQMQTRARLTNGDSVNYGFGLTVGTYRGIREIGHNGADAGYRSAVTRFPDQHLAIAIECNGATANTTALAHGVADVYLASALAPVQQAGAPVATPIAPDVLQRRAGAYIQPTTMTIVELSVRNGNLIAGRTAGPVLVPTSDRTMRANNSATTFSFTDGDHPSLDVADPGQRPTHFERWAPPVTAATALAAYAGEYYSEELDARYSVTASDSMITLRTGTESGMSLRPVFADVFLGGGYTIQFFRKGSAITGFDVTEGRMRHVRFARR